MLEPVYVALYPSPPIILISPAPFEVEAFAVVNKNAGVVSWGKVPDKEILSYTRLPADKTRPVVAIANFAVEESNVRYSSPFNPVPPVDVTTLLLEAFDIVNPLPPNELVGTAIQFVPF